jgi:hypothetical protein
VVHKRVYANVDIVTQVEKLCTDQTKSAEIVRGGGADEP